MQPLLEALDAIPGTEIMTAMFIPDAVEAMIALGRNADAEPLIEELEHNGDRLAAPGWLPSVRGAAACGWPHGATSRRPTALRTTL